MEIIGREKLLQLSRDSVQTAIKDAVLMAEQNARSRSYIVVPIPKTTGDHPAVLDSLASDKVK